MATVDGTCMICGTFGPLSKEHVPPKAAFNSGTVWEVRFLAEIAACEKRVPARPTHQQGGRGEHTLCSPCNNNTGKWYAPELIALCKDARELIDAHPDADELLLARRCRPLNFLKQVLTMFCSSDHHIAGMIGPEFLLSREKQFLRRDIRAFLYLNRGGKPRQTPVVMRSRAASGITTLSELAFPPLGYVLTIDGSDAPDPRMCEISSFSHRRYNEQSNELLWMPVLDTVTPFPGDYRSEEQLRKDMGTSK